MYGVIVTCHGEYGSGIYSGLKLIAGAQENVRVCDFLDGEGFEEIDGKINKAISELKDKYEGILFLTDLSGGTPFNRSVLLSQELENSLVFAGVNFQMLYTAVYAQGSLDEVKETVIEESKSGIAYFEIAENDDDDEFEGDGI